MSTIPLPGVSVRVSAAPATFGDPLDPAVIFAAGVAGRGPTDPVEVHSLQAWMSVYGDRSDGQIAYDSLDLIFRQLSNLNPRVIFKRRVGPSATMSSVTLEDADPANAVTFSAREYGAWADGANGGYAVRVESGSVSGVKVTVLLGGEVVEVHDNLADQAALIAAFADSSHLTAEDAGSGELPVNTVSDANLTGGDDDRSGVADGTLPTDLEAFTSDLGIGLIIVPGVGTTTAHQAIADFAAATNRYGIGDIPAGTSQVTTKSLRDAIKSRETAHRIQIAHSDSVQLPAYVPGGPARNVPSSAAQAATIARSIRVNGHPIFGAAGDNGVVADAVDVAERLTPADWTDLYANHVNPIILDTRGPRQVKVYGVRTASEDHRWQWNPDVLTAMLLKAELEAALEAFLFGAPNTRQKAEQIRERALAIMDRHAAAAAFEPGADYDVDVSASTPAVLQAGQVYARAWYTPPGQTEQIVLDLVAQARAA